jgi:hypothetical protein
MERLTVFAAVMAVSMAPAFAEDASDVLPLSTDSIENYRTWNQWAVFRNNTRGHCFGTKSDDSGVIQLGMTADETMGYIGAFVQQDVTSGESSEIVIQVGDQTFTGETSGPVGNLSGNWHGGYVLANNKNFRRALEKNDTLTAFPDQPYAIQLNIKGANNAIYEIIKCTQEM